METKMSKAQRTEYHAAIKESEEFGLIWSPGSIYHGMKLHDGGDPKQGIHGRMPLSDNAIHAIEMGKVMDFIDYLFNHSEHCDHISEREAFEEFREWQYAQILFSKQQPELIP